MQREEELLQLRQHNRELRELVQHQRETIALQAEHIAQQQTALQQVYLQVEHLQQQVQTLEKQLKKESHNSHLPPSSDRFQRQPKSLRAKTGKPAGGQPGHQGKTLMMVESPDQIVVHPVKACQHCSRSLQDEPSLELERRQVIALPTPRVTIVEHQAQSTYCRHCCQLTQASFPTGVNAPMQYDASFGALAVYLVQYHLFPYERTCTLLEDLFGQRMSVGTLKNLMAQCAEHLAPIESLTKEALSLADVIHQDETGCYVAGKRSWTHVSCTATLTHYALHAQRGSQALQDSGILNRFRGISVHDGWRRYQQYRCGHALCNVHHLRELTFLEEACQQGWATQMKTLLLQMSAHVGDAKASGQSHLPIWLDQSLRQQYQAIIEQGYQANALAPPSQSEPSKQGRRKQHPARNLLDRLSQQEEAVLAFLYDFAVPFDNSRFSLTFGVKGSPLPFTRRYTRLFDATGENLPDHT